MPTLIVHSRILPWWGQYDLYLISTYFRISVICALTKQLSSLVLLFDEGLFLFTCCLMFVVVWPRTHASRRMCCSSHFPSPFTFTFKCTHLLASMKHIEHSSFVSIVDFIATDTLTNCSSSWSQHLSVYLPSQIDDHYIMLLPLFPSKIRLEALFIPGCMFTAIK